MKRKYDYQLLIGESSPLPKFPNLLDAALDEFCAKKYEEASLNEILKKSGMSKGSFYHHFGDKYGLYLAIIDLIVKKKVSYFFPVLQEKSDESGGFFNALRDVMKSTMNFMLPVDERLQHLFSRLMEESTEFRERLYEFFPYYDYSRAFYEHIQKAIASGEIDDRYSPEFVVGIIEIVFSNLYKLVSSSDPKEILDAAIKAVDMMERGIGGKKG